MLFCSLRTDEIVLFKRFMQRIYFFNSKKNRWGSDFMVYFTHNKTTMSLQRIEKKHLLLSCAGYLKTDKKHC